MKKYTGTKTVEATPAFRGDDGVIYPKHTPLPAEFEKLDPSALKDGYMVVYEDGYTSWSPKEVFEKAYKVSETPLDRMKIEAVELFDKITSLETFIIGDKFNELDLVTQGMLKVQRRMMKNYWQILNHRATKMGSGIVVGTYLNFGQAIEYLKAGLLVRRAGWNGKGLCIIKQIPAHIDGDIIPRMQSLPQAAKDMILDSTGFINYESQCLIYNSSLGRADSWTPSISDVFANDWEVVV